MSGDTGDARDDDVDLHALFRARREHLGAAPMPSLDAVVARPPRDARPRRSAPTWRLAAAAVAIAVAAVVVRGVLPDAPRVRQDNVALPAIRMPSDGLLAAAPLPTVAAAWASLPTAALARAPLDPAQPPAR